MLFVASEPVSFLPSSLFFRSIIFIVLVPVDEVIFAKVEDVGKTGIDWFDHP